MKRRVKTTVAGTLKGRARRAAAIGACIELLAREGRGAFSMRRIASDLGVSLGNLQYYFRSESDLLEAVVGAILARSVESVDSRFGTGPVAEVDRGALVDHVLELQQDRTLSVLFFELWALAAHDRRTRAFMVRFYRRYVDRVAAGLPALAHARKGERRARALALVAMLEGVAVLAAGFAGPLAPANWRAIREATLRVAYGRRST